MLVVIEAEKMVKKWCKKTYENIYNLYLISVKKFFVIIKVKKKYIYE